MLINTEVLESVEESPPLPPPWKIPGWVVVDTTIGPGVLGACFHTLARLPQDSIVKFLESVGVEGGGLEWSVWNGLGYQLRPVVFHGYYWPDGKPRRQPKKARGKPKGAKDRTKKKNYWS